jgi:CHASE3 domain sensor protein
MSSSAKANTALAAAVIFLFLSSLAAYFAFARLRTSQLWVQHTRDVQLSLQQFAATETRAARARSQYVDTGDSAFLERYAQSLIETRNALRVSEQLISDNMGHRENFQKLSDLSEQRIAVMNQAIDLKKAGKSTLQSQADVSRQLVAIGEGIDQVLQSMNETEQALLMQRQARERSSFSVIAGILLTSLFLALVLFLIHHRLLTHQVKERLRAESAQRALSARLLTLQDEERRRFAREIQSDSISPRSKWAYRSCRTNCRATEWWKTASNFWTTRSRKRAPFRIYCTRRFSMRLA